MTSQLEPWAQLGDKVVMVTGASSGIGREFCLDLAKSGCRIVAAARRLDMLESLCDEINRLPDPTGLTHNRLTLRAAPVVLDVSADGPAIEAAVRRAWEAFGTVDALVNNAGIAVAVELDVSADGPAMEAAVRRAWDAFGAIDALINNAGVRGSVKSPLDLSEDEWNSTVKTNLTGTWLVSKYVCSRMRDAKKGGSVINISSIGGLNRGHLPGSLAYSCSKAAVNLLTKMMAVELGAHNIRVNSISPGLFLSEITENLFRRDWLKNVAMRTVPLRTHGTSNPALTSLVRYLIHDSSEYISGNIYIVDAGATLPGVPIFSSL
ncbi:hypothetical protein RHSIM_Rhsim03G0036100 [Rhododendron simsii]|uniref:Uncharacterized protein n=1 Tax=Rhododendron simsii TaxID=118357 RepID=A0A834H983_RHOSS|nr:hypothetical protein RHSIM_Rhsim03G0036100 [Rhododendron simsii]